MSARYSEQTGDKFPLIVALLLVPIMAVLVGAAVGAGFYILVAPLVLILPVVYLLLRPDIGVMFFAGLTLLVAGSLKYFFGLGQFQWALSLLGVALLGYSLVRKLSVKTLKRVPPDGISQLMLLWWTCVIFTSMANMEPWLDWLVGLRIYLPVFGIFTYLAYCRPNQKLLKHVIFFMLVIACMQWIFCLYQKLRVVPVRIAGHYSGSPWDSIVGSFGGDKFGGGESGSLGIYLSIIMVLAAALMKYRHIKVFHLLLVLVTALVAMALTESKVIALMIPLGCFLVYRDYVIKRPAKFFAGAVIVGLLLIGLLVVYYYLYWQNGSSLGLVEALYGRFAYSFDPYFKASTTNLGRVGSIIFWWDKHAILDNPLTFLIGHGLASAVSSSSIIGEGIAVQRYGVMLDVTGASKLLWESGSMGLLVFLLIFVFGFFRAKSLKNHPLLPEWHRAAMVGVEAAMVLMPLSLFYEVTVVSSPPMQFMAMFLLGYVAYWWRETEGGRIV
jgi:hypothetical protein